MEEAGRAEAALVKAMLAAAVMASVRVAVVDSAADRKVVGAMAVVVMVMVDVRVELMVGGHRGLEAEARAVVHEVVATAAKLAATTAVAARAEAPESEVGAMEVVEVAMA